MIENEHYTCIGCPIGCPLQLKHEGSEIKEISGYQCNRGAKYARQEFIDPRRSLSTTITISEALWDRLPVKVTGPIHKAQVREAVRKIHQLSVKAPVRLGQVLIEDFMGEKSIHVVSCRSMKRIK
jgi:CxxC motif-containing protein